MPVFNGENYLHESIESILNQTYNNYEFLIIDDNSSDRSIEIINSYKDSRIRLIECAENKGQTIRLNQGLKIAKGKYIARIDQDDISIVERLKKQINFLENNPSVGLLGTKYIQIDKDGKIIKQENDNEELQTNSTAIKWQLLWRQVLGHSTVMFRKKDALKCGGYNLKYTFAQDFALWSTMSHFTKISQLNEVLMKYRVHQHAQSSVIPNDNREKEITLIRKSNIEKLIKRQISLEHVGLIINGSLGKKKISLKEYNILKDYQIDIYNQFNIKLQNKNKYVDMDMVRMMLLWQWYELSINKIWNNSIIFQIIQVVGIRALISRQLASQLFRGSIYEKIYSKLKS